LLKKLLHDKFFTENDLGIAKNLAPDIGKAYLEDLMMFLVKEKTDVTEATINFIRLFKSPLKSFYV